MAKIECRVCKAILKVIGTDDRLIGYYNGHVMTTAGDCIFAKSKVLQYKSRLKVIGPDDRLIFTNLGGSARI
ncbi:MAG: hypothetical protein PHI12_06620 [Dehalococcoidales bacterium]|nr:hypothetical protein [Dehalococcoidales bacterium]